MDSKAVKIGMAVIFVIIFVFAAWQIFYIIDSERKADPVYMEQEAEKLRQEEKERADFIQSMNENPRVLEEEKIEEAQKREIEREMFKTREDMVGVKEVNNYMKKITEEELERDMNSIERNLSKGDVDSAVKTAKILQETYDLNDYEEQSSIIRDVIRVNEIYNGEHVNTNLSCIENARMYIYGFLFANRDSQTEVILDKCSEVVSYDGGDIDIGEPDTFSAMENGMTNVLTSTTGYGSYRVPVTVENQDLYCYILYRKITHNWEILKFLDKDANSRGVGNNTYEAYVVSNNADDEGQTWGIKWRG